jgi:hypothetical protein
VQIPHKGHGLFSFRKAIRHTLAKNTFVDILFIYLFYNIYIFVLKDLLNIVIHYNYIYR